MKLAKSLIKKIPVKIEGTFRGASIILLSGNLGTHLDWDHFQQDLAKYTKVFSYTRPDVIIFNRYNGLHHESENPLFYPDNQWLSFNGQSKILFELLKYYKVEHPYIIVGFSKGGLYALAFANNYDKYIKYVILLDSQIHDLQTPEFKDEQKITKGFHDGNDQMTKRLLKRLEKIEKQELQPYQKTGLYKPINEKSKILNYFLKKHYYYNIKYLHQVPWKIEKPIILFQNIFTTGNLRTDLSWSAWYQHKLRKYNEIMIYTFLDDIHALYITQKKFIINVIKLLRK